MKTSQTLSLYDEFNDANHRTMPTKPTTSKGIKAKNNRSKVGKKHPNQIRYRLN